MTVSDAEGKPTYKVDYNGNAMLLASPLGITTEKQDLTQGLTLGQCETEKTVANYTLRNIKQSNVNVEATRTVCHFSQGDKQVMDVIFWVSNRDVAFRYVIFPQGNKRLPAIKTDDRLCQYSAKLRDELRDRCPYGQKWMGRGFHVPMSV